MTNLEIAQMDIKGAYLNGKLNEEIYMRQPNGFNDSTGRVCQLQHTLYGLKQSGWEWNKTLSIFLKSIGFTKLVSKNCVFIQCDNDEFDIITVWVDDLFIVTTNDVHKNHLKHKFIKNLKQQIRGSQNYYWESRYIATGNPIQSWFLKANTLARSYEIFEWKTANWLWHLYWLVFSTNPQPTKRHSKICHSIDRQLAHLCTQPSPPSPISPMPSIHFPNSMSNLRRSTGMLSNTFSSTFKGLGILE